MDKIILIFIFCFIGFKTCALDLADLKNEQLTYDVMYKGLNVANARMWIEENDSTITLNWTVDTKGLAQILFHVNNVYQVELDSNGRLLQARKLIDQKNIQQTWTIQYDWMSSLAKANQGFAWPVVHDCSNLLAMLYEIRSRPLVAGDSLNYVLDIESQIWHLTGLVSSFDVGNLQGSEIVFSFSPALDIVERAWKTDIITNRMGGHNSRLVIRLGPQQRPLLVQFGNDNTVIEMILNP